MQGFLHINFTVNRKAASQGCETLQVISEPVVNVGHCEPGQPHSSRCHTALQHVLREVARALYSACKYELAGSEFYHRNVLVPLYGVCSDRGPESEPLK